VIQAVVSGLAIGGIYALLAVSFLLIYQVSGVLNFAQGEFVVIGAFVGSTAAIGWGLPVLAAGLLGVLAAGALGLLMERVTYRPLRGKPIATMIISTVAVGIVIARTAEIIWGPEPRSMPSLVPNRPMEILGARVSSLSLFVIVVSGLLLVVQHQLLTRTRLGRRMQATAEDSDTAQLMGIRTGRLVMVAFALGCGLSGAAGIFVAPLFSVTLDLGFLISLKAFAACVVGGFGNLQGAAAAALGLGVVENLAGTYIATGAKDLVAFAVLLAFLALRPQGIFGERVGEKL